MLNPSLPYFWRLSFPMKAKNLRSYQITANWNNSTVALILHFGTKAIGLKEGYGIRQTDSISFRSRKVMFNLEKGIVLFNILRLAFSAAIE